MKFLQKFEFWVKWNGCKFLVLVHFGAQFTAGKLKILLKTKISGKPTFLGISNSISPTSQKKSHISSKINQKQMFWTQIWYKLQSKAMSKGYQNSHIAYNRTIYIYFLDAKFQLLGICCSRLYLEEAFFFGTVHNWINFLIFLFYFILFIFWCGRGERGD